MNSDRANIATTDILLDGSTIPSGLVTNTGRVLARRTSFVEAGVRGWIIKMYECTVTGSNAFSWKKTLIRNSQFTNCPDAIASQERVVVIDSTIMGGVGDGIDAGVSVRVVGSTVSGFEDDGIEDFGGNAKVQNSEISNNGNRGIFSPFLYASVRVQNSIIAGNGAEGIYAPTYRGRVTVTSGSQITGNGLDGISSGPCITGDCPKFVLKDSTATGNGTDSDCGVTLACADLSAGRVPTVSNSTCDHTYDTNSGFPGTNWNVCTLD